MSKKSKINLDNDISKIRKVVDHVGQLMNLQVQCLSTVDEYCRFALNCFFSTIIPQKTLINVNILLLFSFVVCEALKQGLRKIEISHNCSTTRKSLVKGERFMRDAVKPEYAQHG